jgi:hypothetical protein
MIEGVILGAKTLRPALHIRKADEGIDLHVVVRKPRSPPALTYHGFPWLSWQRPHCPPFAAVGSLIASPSGLWRKR